MRARLLIGTFTIPQLDLSLVISLTLQKRESRWVVVVVFVLWRPATTGGATIVRTQKLLFDLRWNLLQPCLGTVRPILIASDVCLESIYLVVGGSNLIAAGLKLKRKSLSDFPRLLEVRGSRAGSPVNQPKNRIPGPIHQIGFTE
jgi:hypothetical protein